MKAFTKFSALSAIFLAVAPSLALPTSDDDATNAAGLERSSPLATVYTTCVNANHVALTFDDGPYIYLRHVSDTLTAAGIQGTFFWNGYNYDCIYNADRVSDVQYVVKAGHEIAQHTWSHPHLESLSYTEIEAEFTKINTALQKITGLTPAFMRPPYGEYNNQVREIAHNFGQSMVTWNQDSGDSVGATMAEQKAVYSNFIKKKNQKAIFLNHEVYKSTAYTLLPYAISELKKGGYEFVTISQCLGKPAYLKTQTPSKRDSSWHC